MAFSAPGTSRSESSVVETGDQALSPEIRHCHRKSIGSLAGLMLFLCAHIRAGHIHCLPMTRSLHTNDLGLKVGFMDPVRSVQVAKKNEFPGTSQAVLLFCTVFSDNNMAIQQPINNQIPYQ